MSSIFSNSPLWSGDHCYVTAHADFLHHQIDPAQLNVGTTCLMTCSSSLFRRLLELVPPVDDGRLWPYSTTVLATWDIRSEKSEICAKRITKEQSSRAGSMSHLPKKREGLISTGPSCFTAPSVRKAQS